MHWFIFDIDSEVVYGPFATREEATDRAEQEFHMQANFAVLAFDTDLSELAFKGWTNQ